MPRPSTENFTYFSAKRYKLYFKLDCLSDFNKSRLKNFMFV